MTSESFSLPVASSFIVESAEEAAPSGEGRGPGAVRGELPDTSNEPLMQLVYDGCASASMFNPRPIRSRSRLATLPRAE